MKILSFVLELDNLIFINWTIPKSTFTFFIDALSIFLNSNHFSPRDKKNLVLYSTVDLSVVTRALKIDPSHFTRGAMIIDLDSSSKHNIYNSLETLQTPNDHVDWFISGNAKLIQFYLMYTLNYLKFPYSYSVLCNFLRENMPVIIPKRKIARKIFKIFAY